jgi:hypothetical protein
MSNTWGPPIWTLFHTIIESVHEDKFEQVGEPIFIFINRICRLLPCPECQEHAKNYLKAQRVKTKSKVALRIFIHKFHNMVNRFKKYKEQPIEILEQYKNKNIIETYNNFVKVFSARGNIRMLADTMQRNMIMKDFKTWILANKEIFIQPSTKLIKTSDTVIADNTVTSKTTSITEHNISDPEPESNSVENIEKVSASIFETIINTTHANDAKLS